MPNGGEITIETQTNHYNFILKVKDSGTGITTEDLPHIFDPFFSRKDNSTGLGLSITQQIIENYHGRIKVKSTPNMGTGFQIQIPTTYSEHV